MEKFARIGDFCPNEACPDYRKLQNDQSQRNIRKFGRTKLRNEPQCSGFEKISSSFVIKLKTTS
jgi:hypothetical protein